MAHQVSAVLTELDGYMYGPRLVTFQGTMHSRTGWHIKQYAVTLAGKRGVIPKAAVQAAERAAGATLPLLPGAGC